MVYDFGENLSFISDCDVFLTENVATITGPSWSAY